MPSDWKKGITFPLHKGKGSKRECKNYRGITLLCTQEKPWPLLSLHGSRRIWCPSKAASLLTDQPLTGSSCWTHSCIHVQSSTNHYGLHMSTWSQPSTLWTLASLSSARHPRQDGWTLEVVKVLNGLRQVALLHQPLYESDGLDPEPHHRAMFAGCEVLVKKPLRIWTMRMMLPFLQKGLRLRWQDCWYFRKRLYL